MPAPRFYEGTVYRDVITTLAGATLTFLDKLASDRTYAPALDRPWTASGKVPSDEPEINILHDDGFPFLSKGNRCLRSFRRNQAGVFVPVHGGIIEIVEDDAASDQAYTNYTSYDPWQLLYQRPVIDDTSALPTQDGITFDSSGWTGDQIVVELLNRTAAAHGNTYIDPLGGTIETTDPCTINFPQGCSVGEAWRTLVEEAGLDIVLTPVYDTSQPNILVTLNIYAFAGEDQDAAIMAWDSGPRSLVGINRLGDFTEAANHVQWYAGQDDAPVDVQADATSTTRYGQLWAQDFFPGQTMYAAVELLAAARLALVKDGKETITLDPAPEQSPIPFEDYNLGDRIPLYASSRFRQAIATPAGATQASRVYGIPITLDSNQTERVKGLLVSVDDGT